MQSYYVFRHGEDNDFGKITERGNRQTTVLIKQLTDSGLIFRAIISSLYPRCLNSSFKIAEALGYPDSIIDREIKLNTQKASNWNKIFYSGQFQKMLPIIGSKYAVALKLCPELLIDDARHFIRQIQSHSRNIPDNVNVLGISHNVMILSAASLIELNKLDLYQKLITLEGCRGIKFDVTDGEIIRCNKINL